MESLLNADTDDIVVQCDTVQEAFEWLLSDYQDKYVGTVLSLLDDHIDKENFILEQGFNKENGKWVKVW